MSTLSDLQKKLQKESEGIMFPFGTAVKKQTTQPVLDTTTDSIMSKTKEVAVQPIDPSEVYKGPAVIRYGAEGQRNLVEPDSGMLAGSPFKFSIDPITGMEKPLPKPGEGIVEDVTPAPTPPITTPVEPEQPAIDPCPPGFKYDPVLQRCVPIEQPRSDKQEPLVNKPRNIGDTAQALGQITNVLREQGVTQDGTYQDDVNYTIDNSTGLSFFGGIGKLLDSAFNKGPADKKLESLGDSTEGITVTKNKDGTRNVLITNNQGKANVGRLLTAESLSGNVASTQKTNAQGNIIRAPNGQLMIQGPVQINPYSKVLFKPETRTAAQTDALNAEEKNKLLKELNDMIPARQTLGKIDEAFYNRDFGKLDTGTIPITQTGGDASVMEEVQSRQTSTRPTTASDAASGADAQRGLMTDTRRLDRVSEPAGQEPDFLRQQKTQERQERKQKEKEQKARIGYGQNIDQDIIDANKRDSDREAQKQTGDSTMRAVTDRYGNPVRDGNGKVVTNPAPKSGGGGGGSGGGSPKSIVCTAMYQSTGLQDWAKAMRIWYIYQKRYLTMQHQEGYHKLFKPFVKGMHKNKIIKELGSHVAKHRTQHLKHIMFNSKPSLLGKIYSNLLEPLCYITGVIKTWKKK